MLQSMTTVNDGTTTNCTEMALVSSGDMGDSLNSPCLAYDGSKVRSICPAACACDDPWKGNMLATPEHGCPGSCAANYIGSLMGLGEKTPSEFAQYTSRCMDIPADILKNSAPWLNYIQALYSLFTSLLSAAQGESLKKSALDTGCDFIIPLAEAGVNVCTPRQGG